MASNRCMNALCGAATSSTWRKGWSLRSGDLADLCDSCGSAYEQSIFCQVFHSMDSGWRDCTSCGKRLHCGCIASKSLLELLDDGRGVNCISCYRSSQFNSGMGEQKSNEFGTSKIDEVGDRQSASADNRFDGETKLLQLGNATESFGTRHLLQLKNDTSGSFRQMKQEDTLPPIGEIGSSSFLSFSQASNGLSQLATPEMHKATILEKDLYEPLLQTRLSITLGSPLGNLNPCPGAVANGRAQSKMSSTLQQGHRSRHLLPKPPKSVLATGLETNEGTVSQIRVARPPAEGRGRNQLLPRYWPRITDQELQQLSGDSNSTIVPLFEKVLSASDAGRIGRLVLPKACAEAYFPPISQPEGLPLKILDMKGKEWLFQFRFWPNNNSRMYVLEGVTPCIHSMQLQAGDTVTFSRMNPEGKLIMGFRKASSTIGMQETRPPAIANSIHSSESFVSGVFENLPINSGYPGLLQSLSLKGSTESHLSALSKHLQSASGDISWLKSRKHEDRTREGMLLSSLLVPERRRTRNIGSKSKRLLIDSLDALELKLTWEEVQDLLRPPPSIEPSIVTIEDHDFEEYEEPPVFGKRSIFVIRSSGGQEQWAQCDSCSKWRKLPIDFLLPSKWICADNVWDQRCSCTAPEELTPSELENLLRLSKDFKKPRMTGSERPDQEHEPLGLDAAVLGDVGGASTTTVATTTKHPRHRPGCSCIVCIQPPSGKGKHKPECTCNVCMTVKRRFKTMMIRKQKRQSEREAEILQKNQPIWAPKDEADVDSSSKHIPTNLDPSETETRSASERETKSQSNNLSNKLVDSNSGHIDLNSHPDLEEESQAGLSHTSMPSLLQEASLPLETYLKQNGLTSLVSEQQASSTSSIPIQAGEVDEGDEGQRDVIFQFNSAVQKQESGGEESGKHEPEESGEHGPDQSQNDSL